MRNITDVLARYLSDINLPSVSIIDVIEIILISFFVYQFMVWIKFTRAYNSAQRSPCNRCISDHSIYFQDEHDPVDRISSGRRADHGDSRYFPA